MQLHGVDFAVVELRVLRSLQRDDVRVVCVRWRRRRQGNGAVAAHFGAKHHARDRGETRSSTTAKSTPCNCISRFAVVRWKIK